VVLEQGETLDLLYRRMVDENLIRTDISFAEMAALARAYAEDPGTAAESADAAVQVLYGSAGKQKRSYIRAFARLMAVLDPHLAHPEAIPRALGLAVLKRMETEPGSVADLKRHLAARSGRPAEDELAILRAYSGENEFGARPAQFPAGNAAPATARPPRKARTTFQIESALGEAKCTASQGRLELRLDTDFTAIDRRRLEAAVELFLGRLSNE
jgi:ParB family chromosome partitioning protein